MGSFLMSKCVYVSHAYVHMCWWHRALQLGINSQYANDYLPFQTLTRGFLWTFHTTRTKFMQSLQWADFGGVTRTIN